MDMTVLLDTLVRLASVGASGICIFAIFWTGWLIMRLPAQADPEQHRTVRFFMVICVAIATVSAGSGILNARSNAGKIAKKDAENKTLHDEHKAVASYLLQSIDQTTRAKIINKASPRVRTNLQNLNLDVKGITAIRHPLPIVEPQKK